MVNISMGNGFILMGLNLQLGQIINPLITGGHHIVIPILPTIIVCRLCKVVATRYVCWFVFTIQL